MLDENDFWLEMGKRNHPLVSPKLRTAKVGIAGAGGIGSNLAVSLARVGVGNLHIVDFDEVELMNLNRQNYRLSDVGQKKTIALKNQIESINPFVQVHIRNQKINSQNAAEIFQDDDVVCEAFDDESEKSMLIDAMVSASRKQWLVAASGMAGFDMKEQMQVRQLGSRLFVCGDFSTDSVWEHGIMSPKVLMCAALCANVVVNLIVKGKL